GSFGAVGADQSAIGINVAGLGLYRKSDFNLTFNNNSNSGKYKLEGDPSNTILKDNKNKFDISSLGLVLAKSHPSYSNWTSSNWYIGYNKTASYNQDLSFVGLSRGSIVHRFLENSLDPNNKGRGIPSDQLDEFESKLAYETGAIFDISQDSNIIIYSNDLINHSNNLIPKKGTFQQQGYQGNLSFAYATNYKEKFLFGLGLDLPTGRYQIDKTYEENSNSPILNPFINLKFTEKQVSEISGVKGNVGFIFKPINTFRIGLSWHTPTLLSFSDTYNTGLIYRFQGKNGSEEYSSNSPDGEYSYNIIVPSKWIGSAAYVSKYGLINVDLDYFQPDKTRFKFKEASEQSYEEFLNQDIKKQYKSVLQTRIGLEIPINKLRIRGGIGILPSAYSNEEKNYFSWSTGLGYRGRSFYFDLASTSSKSNSAYIPFTTGNSDFDGDGKADAVSSKVQSSLSVTNISLSLGFRF
ncbi:MAG: hypothetical protein ABIO44_06760, partial [Saprospiraceae bacterium]